MPRTSPSSVAKSKLVGTTPWFVTRSLGLFSAEGFAMEFLSPSPPTAPPNQGRSTHALAACPAPPNLAALSSLGPTRNKSRSGWSSGRSQRDVLPATIPNPAAPTKSDHSWSLLESEHSQRLVFACCLSLSPFVRSHPTGRLTARQEATKTNSPIRRKHVASSWVEDRSSNMTLPSTHLYEHENLVGQVPIQTSS